ncbi:heparan sulfate glucosamine 3-O-sulfotransferase 3A1-like [Uloborus diversus]|uniref:heparan sulfate glucosamine 3-O-sulfotransferase 3A1-like n=1 Tax=Uloborus diversus TaxID=327109 RepID=UPI00240A1A95|nr:heparan sulfate glucosamine 3-O-sulfotransferase 3A1-like [Uloborus diversus]
MLVRNSILKMMARILIVATGVSLLVCVAFFDVQSHYRNVVVYDGKDGHPWNVSSRRRTLMQRVERTDWKQITNDLKQREIKELLDESESLSHFFGTDSDRGEDESGVKRRLPGAIIIGVKKGGTRALLEILRLHPDVVAPGPEIHFFDRHYKKGLQWYRSQMPVSVDGQLTMEKTPGYLVTPGAPQRIANMSRNLLLLLVVRDPVTRALSDYAQASSKRPQDTRTFEDMAFRNASTGLVDADWTAIRIGQYAKHLERWMRFFPLSQIHVVSGERLVADPVQELQAVQKFLKIRPLIGPQHFFFNQSKGFPCLRKSPRSEVPRCLGKTKGRSHPQVATSSLQRLRDFFRPFNQKFYRMVGRDFQWT